MTAPAQIGPLRLGTRPSALAVAQSELVAQLRDEHADAERGDRGGRAVTGGADGDQLDGVAGIAQSLRDEFGLGDGQRARPGPDPQ